MEFLNKTIDFLNSKDGFIDGWLNSYSFTPKKKDNSKKEIIGKISFTLNIVYEYLNYAIISGEFISSISDFKLKIQEIQNLISTIQSSIELDKKYFDSQEILVDAFLNSFAFPLKNSLKDIDHMCVRYERKFLLNNTDEILFDAISKNSFYDNQKDLTKILRLNIKLTDIDRDLSVNKKLLSELLICNKELENLIAINTNIYLKILRDKCNYLIRKVLYRFNQDSKTSYLYAFDYHDKELTLKNVSPGLFEKFDEITKKHYSIDNCDYNSTEIEKIYEKKRTGSNLDCIEYHHLVKTYKDKNKNLTQIGNLYYEFKEVYKSRISSVGISKYDIKAYHIILNYIKNNMFSIQLDSNLIKLDDAEKAINKIKHTQQETGIRNYFPYLKMCLYLDSILQNTFKNQVVDYNEVENLITKLEAYLKEAYINFEWCKDRNFMAFQLPKKECCLIIDDFPAEIFLSSSFVLPINYEKIELDLKELKRKTDKYKTLCEVHLNLKNEKDEILKLKEKFEKSEMKSIEILGIFSAIVLFTSGSIQIFNIDGITMKDSLIFMLSFSYCLVLFIFLIWLITRDNIKSLTLVHKIFLFGLIIASILTVGYILKSDELIFNKKSVSKETKTPQNPPIIVQDSIKNNPVINQSK